MKLALTLAVVASLSALAPTARAEDVDAALYRCNDHQATVVVTFKPELEIKELITWAVGFSCKELIFDARTIGARKVTVIAPTKMSRAEAWQLFEVSLSTAGLAVVPKGKALRIVESQSAKKESIAIVKSGAIEGGDTIVRTVIKPTYASADALKAAFLALKSDAGDVFTVGALVVVTDFAGHVRDMLSLAALVDVPSGSDGIYTIAVHHADAAKLADKVTTLVGAAVTKVLVDERTNTLVVAGTEVGYQRARALVERLDLSLAMEDGVTVHIHRLNNGIAEELARTLTEAITAKAQAQPQVPGGKPVAALEGQARVIGDKATNSLIVTASAHDFLAIKDLITQLDIPRRQVFIEALILEVAISDGLDLGTSSHGGVSTSGGSLVIGGVQTGGVSTLGLGTTDGAASLAGVSGLVGGIVGTALANSTSLLGTSIPSYAVLFNAVANSSNANILSAPSIIALDNEEAKYKVGTNIPYKKGLSFPTSSSTSTSPFNSVGANIDRQDLVLELDIKPHISENDMVLLEIKHDSKDLGDKDAELGPTWTTRNLETRVLVQDQHTIAIGGLMQTRDVVTSSKVPILGDIPLLGHLFKYTSKSKKKSNLLILLTPYIVKDQADLEAIRERKAREHDEFVRSFSGLERSAYLPAIDYRKKRGVVEEINRAVLEVEADTAARAVLHQDVPTVDTGVIEVRP
ncbi:MAG: type II secretion system secretin GspD [Proteobacteria bacterium]|nr:type II secretion system secretin GspD [Pseudomonadota bacterium]